MAHACRTATKQWQVPDRMQTYLVGGAVRDQLLDYPVYERDWVVVGATPDEMLDAGFRPVGKDFPVFLHPQSQEEYALARTERKSGRGYHGFVCHSSPDVTLEQDLARRDLTINAMAEAPDGTLIDPYGGHADLQQRLLRHVSPAFGEDPLRILRVARFAARYHHLGFRVAAETMALMHRMVCSGEADFLVAERIWKELERALGEASPHRFFETLRDCGALAVLMPELESTGRQGWQALTAAADAGLDETQRLAALAASLTPASVDSLCARLKAPTRYMELARMSARHTASALAARDTGAVVALLRDTDALRRPERFDAFLAVCIIHGMSVAQRRRLSAAREAAAAVSSQPLVANGLTGKALGRALQQTRSDAVAACLANDHTDASHSRQYQ